MSIKSIELNYERKVLESTLLYLDKYGRKQLPNFIKMPNHGNVDRRTVCGVIYKYAPNDFPNPATHRTILTPYGSSMIKTVIQGAIEAVDAAIVRECLG